MRGAPQREFSRLIFRISLRTSLDTGGRPRLAAADLPRPQQPKALAVPADHGLWLNDHKSKAPANPELGQSCPEESICGGQLRSFDRALQDAELVAQSKDLKLKGRSGPEQRRKRREQCCENGGWRESREDGQLPLYQPNRDFREPKQVGGAGSVPGGASRGCHPRPARDGGGCCPQATCPEPMASIVR
jgi:hypothetical protein